jgi:fibronectin-binding autotransporter adhesin
MNATSPPLAVSRQRSPLARLLVCGLAVVITQASAQSIWNGGGADNNWTTPLNWGGTAPTAGSALQFSGTTRLTPANNFATDTTFNGISFDTTAGAFTLSGNRITLGGNVANDSSVSQTLGLNLILSGSRTFHTTAANLVLSGVVSGAGLLEKDGSHTLVVTNSNSYSGGTNITAGALQIGNGGATGSLGNGAVVNNGTLIVNRSNALSLSFNMSGTGVLSKIGSNTLTIDGRTWTFAGSSNVQEGVLELHTSTLNGASHSISVAGGAKLQLRASSVTGGSLTNNNLGIVEVFQNSGGSGTSTFGGTLNNLSGGVLTVFNSSKISLTNGSVVNNDGLVNISATSFFTSLGISGNVSVLGSGSVVLNHASLAKIEGSPNTSRITFGVGQTVRGIGLVGDGSIGITNEGLIHANGGGVLSVRPSTTGAINDTTGVMRASTGSTLKLTGNTLSNLGSIEADGGIVEIDTMTVSGNGTAKTIGSGTIALRSASLTGGVLETSSGGMLQVYENSGGSGNSTFGGTLNHVSGATLTIYNKSTLSLSSGTTVNNDGLISLTPINLFSSLSITGNVTLAGSGTVAMNNASLAKIIGSPNTSRLTIGVGQTIRGKGLVGDGSIGFTNDGTIHSDDGGLIVVRPSTAGVTNSTTGVIKTSTGSSLKLLGNTMANSGLVDANGGSIEIETMTVTGAGQIQTSDSGVLWLRAASVTGGSLVNSSSGTINFGQDSGGGGSSTFGGTMTNPAGGAVVLHNQTNVRLTTGSTITNHGSIQLNPTTFFTQLTIGGSVQVGGTGTVNLTHESLCKIVGSPNTSSLTVGEGQTIQGKGQLGENSLTISNSGLILANGGGTLKIDPNATAISNTATGILRVVSGSTLLLTGGSITNSGRIEATGGSLNITYFSINGGVIDLSGTTNVLLDEGVIAGGTLIHSGSGAIWADGSSINSSSISSAVTLSGSNSFMAGSNRTLHLTGGLSKDSGTTTFGGTGTINVNTAGIGGASSNANILVSGGTLNLQAANTYGGSTTVTGGNVTLSGAGTLPDSTALNITGASSTVSISGISAGSETIGSLAGTGGTMALGSKILLAGGNNSSTTFAGVISGSGGSLTKVGTGTLTLTGTNTYTGGNTFREGTVSVSTIGNGGSSGGIGGAGNGIAFMVFDGGALQYTGASASSHRSYTINAGKMAIWDVTTNTLTLTGASAVTTGGLQKKGAGTLVISGNNGHTGTTLVSEGTLTYGIASALSTGAVTVDGATATLNLSTFSDSVGAVLVDNGGTITGSGTLTSTDGFEIRSGTVSAPLAGSVALLKTGSGTAVLSGSNTYTGQTTVSEGTLTVNGSLANGAAATDVVVQSGASLSGSGTISGALGVSSGGTLAPGAGVGILTTGSVGLASSATFSIEIEGDVPGTSHDRLHVNGTVQLGSANLVISGSHTPSASATYILIDNDGTDAIVGTFNGLPEGGIVTINGVQKAISYVGGTGNDVVLSEPNYAPTAITVSPSALAEKNSAGATVGALAATDANTADTHTFTLVSGTGDADNGSFSIVGNDLKVGVVTNYEVKSSYSVRIKATDNRGAEYEQSIQVTITDVNDAPSDITLNPSSLAENTAAPAVVGTLTATDEDAAASHVFTFVGGAGSTDNALFSISGTTLSLTESANFEVKSTYNLRVQADDGAGGTYEEALVVSITDVNEPATDLTLSNANVDENQPANTAVGTLSATGDPETSQTHTFTLVSGTGSTDNASFNISGSTLQTSASFNYEQKSSYSIRVRATDNGSPAASFEEVFTISINDMLEAVPTARYAGSAVQFNGTSQWAEAPHIAAHLSASFTVEAG